MQVEAVAVVKMLEQVVVVQAVEVLVRMTLVLVLLVPPIQAAVEVVGQMLPIMDMQAVAV
jgi:hypothetical protein